MVTSGTFISDIFSFIKEDLLDNIEDPIANSRKSNSRFILTSYPQREVDYPIVTIKMLNQTANRAGMQTEAMDVSVTLEIRVWARNQKEKDEIANDIYKRLRDIQFTDIGSEANRLHDFKLLSMIEIDESGDNQPKSRVIQVNYKFYDI